MAADAAAACVTATSEAAPSHYCAAATVAKVRAAVAAPAAADAAAHSAQAEASTSRAPKKSPSPPPARGAAAHGRPRSANVSQLQHRHARSSRARSPRAAAPPMHPGSVEIVRLNARKSQHFSPQSSAPPCPGGNGSSAEACCDAGIGSHRVPCGCGAARAGRCGAHSCGEEKCPPLAEINTSPPRGSQCPKKSSRQPKSSRTWGAPDLWTGLETPFSLLDYHWLLTCVRKT